MLGSTAFSMGVFVNVTLPAWFIRVTRLINSCVAEEESVKLPSLIFSLFCVFYFFFSVTLTKSLDQSLLLGLCLGLTFDSPNVKINECLSSVKLTVRQTEGTL